MPYRKTNKSSNRTYFIKENTINKNKSNLNEICSLKRKLENLIDKILKIQIYDPKKDLN